MKLFFLFLFVLLFPILAFSQVDSIQTDEAFFRMKSENDMWATHKTFDRYFTNGLRLQYQPTQRVFKGSPLKKLFIPLRNTNFQDIKVGFIADTRMYTPEDLTVQVPNPGDRPYAGTLSLGMYGVSNNFETATRITTEYQFGVLGPLAGQKEIQVKWHKFVRKTNFAQSDIPLGWDSQIQNTPIINLHTEYERNIFSPARNMETVGGFEFNFGTLTNYIGFNTQVRLGLFNDYFYNLSGLKTRNKAINTPKRKSYYAENINRNFQIYVFAKPSVRFTLYNSLLEGSPVRYNSSNYTLSSDDINHLHYSVEFGGAIAYKRFLLLYSQQGQSAEFKTAKYTKWGGFTFIVNLGRR
jgi:lipid A 3-O-deacylase